MSRARDIMTGRPTTIASNASVGDAGRLLQQLDIRHLPVVGSRGELVGMLSDRDVRALSIPPADNPEWVAEFFKNALGTKVGSVMSRQVISIDEDKPVGEIIELMLTHKVGALPVLDVEGRIVGIVSYIDVLRALQPFAPASE